MKKVLFTMVIAAGLYACGGGEETTETKPISNATTEEAAAPVKEEATTKAEEPPKEETKAVAKKDGKALIAGSDCRTCHKDDQKLIGPAYQDVAKKYEKNAKNVKMLARLNTFLIGLAVFAKTSEERNSAKSYDSPGFRT